MNNGKKELLNKRKREYELDESGEINTKRRKTEEKCQDGISKSLRIYGNFQFSSKTKFIAKNTFRTWIDVFERKGEDRRNPHDLFGYGDRNSRGFYYNINGLQLDVNHRITGRTSLSLKKNIEYYELEIVKMNTKYNHCFCGIGFAMEDLFDIDNPEKFVGWIQSIGLHSDDGRIRNCNDGFIPEGTEMDSFFHKFGKNDIIGAGRDKNTDEFFFTFNGQLSKRFKMTQKKKCLPTISFFVSNFQEFSEIVFRLNDGIDTCRFPFKFAPFNVKPTVARKPKSYSDIVVYCEN